MQKVTATFGLLERFRNGDQRAFSQLFGMYRTRLALLIHYKLSPALQAQVEVDDLVQETFFAASRDLHQFTYQSPGSFFRWLSRIAERAVLDAARFQNREKRRADEVVRFRSESNPGGPEPDDSCTPSRLLASREEFERLFRRLNELPEDYRQVILLAKIEGLTTQEVAEKMGKTRESVALLLHRAIRRFRQLQESAEAREEIR